VHTWVVHPVAVANWWVLQLAEQLPGAVPATSSGSHVCGLLPGGAGRASGATIMLGPYRWRIHLAAHGRC
jgi:hypothetical protein